MPRSSASTPRGFHASNLVAARVDDGAALPGARAHDARDLGLGVRGRAVRCAPAARRAGGLDRLAQGRALRRLLRARAAGATRATRSARRRCATSRRCSRRGSVCWRSRCWSRCRPCCCCSTSGRCGARRGASQRRRRAAPGREDPLRWRWRPRSRRVTFAVQPVVQAGGHSLEVRIANAHRLARRVSAGHVVWPSGLAVFYPHPGAALPRPARCWRPRCALALVTVAVRWRAAGADPLARDRLGIWFWRLLAPVLGLVEVGLQARADRYMYLPLAGLALDAAPSAEALALARRGRRGTGARRGRTGVALLVALAVASRAQLEHWRDSERLYARAVAVTRDNYVAHTTVSRGCAASQGRLDEAHDAAAQAAVRRNPGWTLAWERLAEVDLAREPTRVGAGRSTVGCSRRVPRTPRSRWERPSAALRARSGRRGALRH